MQLALRPYASAASIAVLGAGLIYVTPVAAPHIEQRAIHLAAAETLGDLVGPVDAVASSLSGLGADLSGVLSSLGDLSGTFTDAASALPADTLELFDPAFWQQFWADLLDPNTGATAWSMLTDAVQQLLVVSGAYIFAVTFWGTAYLVSILQEIAQTLGIQPFAAAAEGLGSGWQGVSDTALAGVIDPALPASATTGLADITSLFSDAAAVLDPTTLFQDLSTAFDASALTSILDLTPIANIGTGVDAGTISDLSGMLTSLIP
jgi:hypothetical protein